MLLHIGREANLRSRHPSIGLEHDPGRSIFLAGLRHDDLDGTWLRLRKNAGEAAELADLDEALFAIRMEEWQPVAMAA